MFIEKLLNPDWNEVGKRCGFTRVHVARVVRGQNRTTLDGAARIAKVLGVTLDQLQSHIESSRAARANVHARSKPSRATAAKTMVKARAVVKRPPPPLQSKRGGKKSTPPSASPRKGSKVKAGGKVANKATATRTRPGTTKRTGKALSLSLSTSTTHRASR